MSDNEDNLRQLCERQKAISKEIEEIYKQTKKNSKPEHLKEKVSSLWKEFKTNQECIAASNHPHSSVEASIEDFVAIDENFLNAGNEQVSADVAGCSVKPDPEDEFTTLCERQITINEKINFLYENFKGTRDDQRTKEFLKDVRDKLEEFWLEFKNNHSSILKLKHTNQAYETELVDNIVVLRGEFIEELQEALEDNKSDVKNSILSLEPQITLVTGGTPSDHNVMSPAGSEEIPEVTKRSIEIFTLQNSHTCRVCLTKTAISLVPLETRNETAKSVAELILECTGIDVSVIGDAIWFLLFLVFRFFSPFLSL